MVAGGRFAPGHLGELTQQVPFEMAGAVLEQTCRLQRRVHDLPARVVVYLLLAGCLFAELGYFQVWGKLTAGLEGLPAADPTVSAMTQARRRLGPGPLRERPGHPGRGRHRRDKHRPRRPDRPPRPGQPHAAQAAAHQPPRRQARHLQVQRTRQSRPRNLQGHHRHRHPHRRFDPQDGP
ncbi:transposase domain-containing protein [Trebonia kvetii]